MYMYMYINTELNITLFVRGEVPLSLHKLIARSSSVARLVEHLHCMQSMYVTGSSPT